MICIRCGATYASIVCPDCVERASREATMRAQPSYLARVLDGRLDLRLVRIARRKPHVELFGDPDRAYCGEPLPPGSSRGRVAYNQLLPDAICLQCAQALANMLHIPLETL